MRDQKHRSPKPSALAASPSNAEEDDRSRANGEKAAGHPKPRVTGGRGEQSRANRGSGYACTSCSVRHESDPSYSQLCVRWGRSDVTRLEISQECRTRLNTCSGNRTNPMSLDFQLIPRRVHPW